MSVLPPSNSDCRGVPVLGSTANFQPKSQSKLHSNSLSKSQSNSLANSQIRSQSSPTSISLVKSQSESQPKPESHAQPNSRLVTRRYTPHCELAEQAVHQMAALELHASLIIKAMGYPRQHTIAASERLRYVLSSPYMGLDGSYIDAYYDAKGFLLKLCELLQIGSDVVHAEIALLSKRL